jgi:hypothetical protein
VTFHGYGTGGGNGGCQIGLAYGENLRDLTIVKDPIVPTEKGTYWSGTTGRRDIFFCDGYYYMVYEISTEEVSGVGYVGAYWTHMFARSKDMINWQITEGPQFVSSVPGFGCDGPCWVVIDGELQVFVRAGSTASVKLVMAE